MGQGPRAFVDHGLVERLGRVTDRVETCEVDFPTDFSIELATTFGVLRATAEEVRRAAARGEFPLVLSGSCTSTVGALAGLGQDRIGLIWFDAHGDFHTPETTVSGFLGGLPLSIVVGHCFKSLAATIPGYRPLAEDRVVMVGLRDIDPPERVRFNVSKIRLLELAELGSGGIESILGLVVESLRSSVDSVYIHFDLDVCDPELAAVNSYQPPGGLTPQQAQTCLRLIASKLPIHGASVTAYDPDSDPAGFGMSASLDIIGLIGELAGQKAD